MAQTTSRSRPGTHLRAHRVRLSAYAGDLPPAVLQDFLDAVAAGSTLVPIARVYDFTQIVAAHAAMEASGASGKLVVTT
jgi:NADPH2:quinone reductase